MDSHRITIRVSEDLKDLIPGFLARRRGDVALITSELKGEDLERIRITGHSMKGTGGGYGFAEISSIGARIEAAALKGDRDSIERCVVELQEYLDRVDVEFE